MDNWNNVTPRRTGQRPANDYASCGDLSAVRRDYRAPDYSLLGEVYAGTHYHIGPPPLGAFPGHRGMGRRAPAPSSVVTEKFVQCSQQRDRVDSTGCEDSPEFIPAAQQQPTAGSARSETGIVANMLDENRSCANWTGSGTHSTNGSNDNEGGGSGEKGSARGERDGGFAARHSSLGQGGERRPGAQGLGSDTVGRRRGRGCNWREPVPRRKQPTPAVRNREGVDGAYVPAVYSGRGRGGGEVGSGRAPEGDRDRGRMVQEGGGSGPVEREAENGGPEGRRDAASRRRKKLHRESGTKLWRGGSSRGRAEEPRTAGGDDSAAAAANHNPVSLFPSAGGDDSAEAAADHSPVSNDRKAGEEDRSQKWFAADAGTSSPRNHSAQSRGEDSATDWDRREQLSAQLMCGSLDCLVCWDPLRPHSPVWSCPACYHVLHLACARRWALSSLGGSRGWPCPACRHKVPCVPTEYRCWCGKRREPDPDWSPSQVPHGCGEQCGKPRGAATGCDHRCVLRCHPGPCPPCDVQVNRWCGCGRERRLVDCGQQAVCGAVCGLPLSCGRHCCERTCHPVPCDKCQLLRTVVCWGGRMTRQVSCDSDEARADGFACNLVCGRVLAWGNFQAIVPCGDANTIWMIIVVVCYFYVFFTCRSNGSSYFHI